MSTIGVDIGGTFTDVVLMRDDGTVGTAKSPTTPGRLLDGLLDALGQLARAEGVELAALLARVDRIAHGTTAATNAYLERRGARVALLTTRGFEDTVFMQRMLGMTAGLSAAELTDYSKRRVPEPLVPRALVFGIRERVDYRGEVIAPLVEADVLDAIAAIRSAGVEAIAVCFLWSFKNPDHERRTAALIERELPDIYRSVSSDLVPRVGEYERTATTLVNAYLGPLIEQYTRALEQRLGGGRLMLLDSAGGVMAPAEAARAPVRLLLSGPSGGVTAAQYLGRDRGHPNIISFDMGGTSTDVGLIVDGTIVQRHETEAEKYHLLLPMVDVRAIGAGGGSIAQVETGGYLRVGPRSAGAEPGPACYGRGGTLPTVTDADLLLGFLDPGRFLGGRLVLDVERARSAVDEHVARPLGLSVEAAAIGVKRIVDTRMADLLRTATVARGYDPRRFVLYAFGGAGATHAPAFALELVEEILVPATQAVFCAFGAVASDVALTVERAEPKRLARARGGGDVDPVEIEALFAELETRARAALTAQRIETAAQRLQRLIEVRFIRQNKALAIPYRGSVPDLVEDFLAAYARRYGRESVPETAGFELVTFAVRAIGALPRPALPRGRPGAAAGSAVPRMRRRAYDAGSGQFVATPVFDGARLGVGTLIEGPAIIDYDATTVALASGQAARVDELADIVIRRSR